MIKRLEISEVRERCLKRGFVFLGNDYKNVMTNYKIKCIKHNEIHSSSLCNIFNGVNLKCCGIASNPFRKRTKIKEVIKWCSDNNFEFRSQSYDGQYGKYLVKCLKHNEEHLVMWKKLKKYKSIRCCWYEKQINVLKRFNTLLGENHPCYHDTLSDEDRKLRRSGRVNKWRKEVREFYKNTCQSCGRINLQKGNCISHHLESYRTNTKLRFSIKNGVALCTSCHITFHKTYGYGNNTRKQFDEFKKARS